MNHPIEGPLTSLTLPCLKKGPERGMNPQTKQQITIQDKVPRKRHYTRGEKGRKDSVRQNLGTDIERRDYV